MKINIYSVKNGLPSESLLDENIIYKTTITAWQKIDLSPYKFRFKNVEQIAVTVQLVDYKKLENQDFVVIARKGVEDLSYQDIYSNLVHVLKIAKLYKD